MEGTIAPRSYQQIAPSQQTQPVQPGPPQQHYMTTSDVASLQRQVDRITQEGQFLSVQPNDVQQIGVLENEKLLVYRHPLFPLLGKIFEKCEVATNSLDAVNSQTFDQEIKSFIMQQAKENKPFFTDDADTDQLMLKALQVLRIHLLEMEKVNELCKDFCSRYIACLKGKLNSENLMRTLNINSDSPPPEDFVDGNSPISLSPVQHSQNTSFASAALASQFGSQRQVEPLPVPTLPQQTSLPLPISPVPPVQQLTPDMSDSSLLSTPTSPMDESPSLGDADGKKNASKRGIFPKHATNIMKAWLFQHLVHPYPTEDEKRQIASQTNLTILQVNNWFINARRRILQPMLDSNTSYASLSRAKKIKPQKIPAQRAWPETIGVYSGYAPVEGIQYQTAAAAVPAGYTVVNPGLTPQGPMIVNVATANNNQPLTIGSQVQLVQVSTVPTVVQAVPAGLIQVTPSGQVTASGQAQSLAVDTSDLAGAAVADTKTSATAFRVVESSTGHVEAGKKNEETIG